jgi:hypothetical protein
MRVFLNLSVETPSSRFNEIDATAPVRESVYTAVERHGIGGSHGVNP